MAWAARMADLSLVSNLPISGALILEAVMISSISTETLTAILSVWR